GGTFRGQVRFIGAGTIGVAAIWSLLKIIGPIIAGLRSALAASRARQGGQALDITERDMPIGVVALITLATLVPIAWLLWSFSAGGP
ncbi:oligopeptide transporter, OPT family, partial [Escherichia coli]|nr:oligopeptide transporter, OPT family [Escherichia coli]